MIVIRDADGVRLNIKKANVDNEKTKTANPPSAEAAPIEQSKPAESAASVKKNETKQPSKRPAKKLTKEDLEKLRDKYDLGEGTFSEEALAYTEPSEDKSADPTRETNNAEGETDNLSVESEAEWRSQAQQHREALKAAEQRSQQLDQQCETLKQISVQTHDLVDEQGNQLPINETVQQMCEMADSAKAQLEQEQTDLDEFMNEAKEKGVPPGWLRDEQGNEPNEQQ
jgi:hypothetical protein